MDASACIVRIGILGGTGFAAELSDAEEILVDTAWGSVPVFRQAMPDIDIFFVNRHGAGVVPPHRIVHRANIDALARCKVDAVFAINAVGALDAALQVPSLLVPDDFVDLRKTSETFFDTRAVHVDVSEAYCPTLRALLVQSDGAHDGGIYVATEGPRLETRAEIRMMRAMGGTVVGMTGCPEAALARERALCYASLCLVVNAAPGVTPGALQAATIKAGAAALAPRAWTAVLAAARATRPERECCCRAALDGAAL